MFCDQLAAKLKHLQLIFAAFG